MLCGLLDALMWAVPGDGACTQRGLTRENTGVLLLSLAAAVPVL